MVPDEERPRLSARGTVRVEAGATWADLNHELQVFGLAATGGYVGTTGVAGPTLGGGLGWTVGASTGWRSTTCWRSTWEPRMGGGAHRQRKRARGPVLGGVWRRWELRDRHLI